MDEALEQPRHREHILTALSQVPIATTKQLAMLNTSLNPRKKATRILQELADDKLVEGEYFRREKVWRLTRHGRALMKCSPMRYNRANVDHALAVINLYFTLRPSHWMFEPVERFEHLGKKMAWNPDAVFVHQRKLYALELQLSPISSKEWAKRKWSVYNTYFNRPYFLDAAYQQWSTKGAIKPNILVLTTQQPETVRSGYAVEGRELIVTRSMG